ncbi:hypothetical protein SAMN05445504_3178 [Burkholderia sp. CF099]|nr:hypothetical protein SAMN05445504_3178 [Burkholderia sp. CF099]
MVLNCLNPMANLHSPARPHIQRGGGDPGEIAVIDGVLPGHRARRTSALLGKSARSHTCSRGLLPVAITLRCSNRDSGHSITLISRSRARLPGGAEILVGMVVAVQAPRLLSYWFAASVAGSSQRSTHIPASIQAERPSISHVVSIFVRTIAHWQCAPVALVLENVAFLFFDDDVPGQGDLRRETWGRHCSCSPH